MAILKSVVTVLCACALLQAGLLKQVQADDGTHGDVLILCYHSIQPKAVPNNPYTVTRKHFVEQLEYLHAHGYNPVSLQDIAAAADGSKPLPEKAVFLTFDDAYRSYYDFVAPLLRRYGYPSMLAVVGAWIENKPPDGLPEQLMTWKQIRQIAADPLVAVASHSYDLHKAIAYTPQGNVGAAVAVRAFDQMSGSYETQTQYRQRLEKDFERQRALFEQRMSSPPQAMVWPFGYYNALSMDIARRNGLELGFCLDEGLAGTATVTQPRRLNRVIVTDQSIDMFIYRLKHLRGDDSPMRAVQVDLDLVYDSESAEKTDRNLGRLIDRLVALKVNTVFLQAFADPDGEGTIRSVYFKNRVLPVRADIFAHAVHQMHFRGMKVYAWMPGLGIQFQDRDFNQRYGVLAYKNGRTAPAASGYQRLTPFSSAVAQRVGMLFEDMASNALISGVLFQDDAFLSDEEDVHPQAMEAFSSHIGRRVPPASLISDEALRKRWTRFKTDRLMAYLDEMADSVRKFRPDARFARNIYARLLTQPEAEQWFAQNYTLFLNHYDYVVVMAYPQMELARRPVQWLEKLAAAGLQPLAAKKTVFKLQTFDWRRRKWLDDTLLLKEMRAVLAAGIRHLAYYPDNLWDRKPDVGIIGLEMSTKDQMGDQ